MEKNIKLHLILGDAKINVEILINENELAALLFDRDWKDELPEVLRPDDFEFTNKHQAQKFYRRYFSGIF